VERLSQLLIILASQPEKPSLSLSATVPAILTKILESLIMNSEAHQNHWGLHSKLKEIKQLEKLNLRMMIVRSQKGPTPRLLSFKELTVFTTAKRLSHSQT